MTIAPSECINCRLCENSCPVGAINKSTSLKEREKPNIAIRRYVLLSIIVPLLVIAGSFIGSNFHYNLAQVNPKVKLAREVSKSFNSNDKSKESVEYTAFKSSGQSVEKLYAEANSKLDEFYWGGLFFGGFIGLVFGLTLVNLTVFRYRTEYTPNKATCHSCGRCMDYCPVKKETVDI